MLNDECRMMNARRRIIRHSALCIQHSPQGGGWWRQSDSNRRHSACKADALPTELCPHWRGRRGPAAFRSGLEEFQFSFWEARRASPPRHVSPGLAPGSGDPGQNRRIDHRNSRLLGVRLLRKEVIQPQVPLRLPCYDFIPITTHTLGDSLPCGLGRRLRVQTAFMM